MSINILFKLKDENGTIIPKNIFWLAFFGVLAVCVLYVVIMFFVPVKAPVNMESRGAFGDMFGAIGALFSGLAFAGLIVTMLQQREDLKNQKDEMKLQREEIELQRKDLEAQTEALRLQKEEIAQTNQELQKQRAEMEEQNKTMMLQRFENTFFNLLDMQKKIVNALKYESMQGKWEGQYVFERMYRNFWDYAFNKKIGDEYMHLSKESPIEDFLKCYGFALSSGQISYFDHLYRIMKFVDQASYLENEEKYNYICILRAQLSKPELLMTFYFCLYERGYKLKKLVEQYAFFKHIRNNRFVSNRWKDSVLAEEHYRLFTPGAYALAATEYPF